MRERHQRSSHTEEMANTQEAAEPSAVPADEAPPLPPKPKQKISAIGLPNTDQFIVMDNTAVLGTAVLCGAGRPGKQEEAGGGDCHSRSDSGLSSLGSWPVTQSGCSSVRSSSIVSDCSSKIEELFEDQNKNTTFLSMCSLKLENLNEQDEMTEKVENEQVTEEPSGENVDSSKLGGRTNGISKRPNHAARDEPEKNVDDYDYDDVCQSSTVSGVQRQLETIKHQKEMLIKDVVQNEELGMGVSQKLAEVMTERERDKYQTFVEELEKVVLLLLSINSRLEKAEEELSCGNLTDWDKESRRYKRDKLIKQLNEALELRRMSDRRMANVEKIIEKYLEGEDLEAFKMFIERKEQLLTTQKAVEDSEKNILH